MTAHFIIFIFVPTRRHKALAEILVGTSKLLRNLIPVLSDIFIWFYLYSCVIKILIVV